MQLHKTYKHIFALTFYLLVLFVFFYKAFIGGYVFGIGDFTGSDLLDLHLPFKYILSDSYKQYEFPLWTPFLANGFPVLAEGQSGALYPPNIVFAVTLPPYLALNYSVLLALLIAGLGAYLFTRKVFPNLPFSYALLVGTIFMLCSFFVARLKHLNMIVVAAYLPWALYCVRSYFSSKKMYWFVLLGIVWALQLLAGHPHMFYLTLIMVGWHVIVEMIYKVLRSGGTRLKEPLLLLKQLGVGLLVAGVVGIGLAAPQVLATAELAVQSSRVNGTFINSIAYPLSPKFLLTFLNPYIYGNPADGTYRLDIVRDGIWWENVLYIGVIPFIVVIFFTLLTIRRFLRNSTNQPRIDSLLHVFGRLSFERYMLGMLSVGAAFFLYWAMGRYSIIYMISYYGLPGMQLFRFPTRFSLYTLFALAIVFGYALHSLLLRCKVKQFYQNITMLSVFIVVLGDLYFFSSRYISFFPVDNYLKDYSSKAVAYSADRIYPMTQYAPGPYAEKGWFAAADSIYALQAAFPGNFPAVYGLMSFTDRGWFEGGLSIKERNLLERTIIENGVGLYGKLLGLWNVGTLFSFDTLTDSAFVVKESVAMPDFFNGSLYIYSNQEVTPRVYFSRGIKYVAKEEEFIRLATESAFSPYSYVFTTKRSDQRDVSESIGDSLVSIIKSKAQYVSLRVQASQSGYVVLSDTFYPGWEVFVDGVRQAPLQVNLVQRAVAVNKGEHLVEWRYKPKLFIYGLYASAFIGVGILLYSGYLLLQKRG